MGMHEHYDQFLFCLGVKKHCLWRFEGEDFGECPRRSVAGAWSRVGALGCWRSYGAVFGILFQMVKKYQNFAKNILSKNDNDSHTMAKMLPTSIIAALQ